MRHENQQQFPYLRRRLFRLQQEIYTNDHHADLTPDTKWDQMHTKWLLENDDRMSEAAEIQFVLQHFERDSYKWTVRAQAVFAAAIIIITILAIVAAYR